MMEACMSVTFIGTEAECLDRARIESSGAARWVYRRINGTYEVHDAPTVDTACIYVAHMPAKGNGRSAP